MPNGIKTQGHAHRTPTQSAFFVPTITASVRTERRKDMARECKNGNTRSQPARGLPVQTEVALVSIQSELSNVSHNVGFFDNDLDHINSTTAENNIVDACTGLATYSAAHPCYACCLCFSSLVSCRRPLIENRAHPCGGLRSWLLGHLAGVLATAQTSKYCWSVHGR